MEKLYTILVFSENIAGILNQVTAVFTRRQVNIESLNVSASSTPGVHKYTITCYCTEEMVKMLKAQIEKRIDVLQARYYTDDAGEQRGMPHCPTPRSTYRGGESHLRCSGENRHHGGHPLALQRLEQTRGSASVCPLRPHLYHQRYARTVG